MATDHPSNITNRDLWLKQMEHGELMIKISTQLIALIETVKPLAQRIDGNDREIAQLRNDVEILKGKPAQLDPAQLADLIRLLDWFTTRRTFRNALPLTLAGVLTTGIVFDLLVPIIQRVLGH